MTCLIGCASCPPRITATDLGPRPRVPEFTLEEVQATPPSVWEKVAIYFAESIGYQKKAAAALGGK